LEKLRACCGSDVSLRCTTAAAIHVASRNEPARTGVQAMSGRVADLAYFPEPARRIGLPEKVASCNL